MNSNKKLYKNLIFLGLFGLAVAGMFWMGQSLSQSQETASIGNIVEEFMPSEGRVTLVEFSDFQCPACGYFHPIVKQLLSEYGDKIDFRYKHFPLKSIHKNAELAAKAAEAARLQDRFSEMSDMLFTKQTEWSNSGNAKEIFVSYAGSLGLDTEKFNDDIDSAEVNSRVSSDVGEGNKLGLRGTPTFFVNGSRIKNNPSSYNEFKALIDQALAQ